MNIAVSLDNIFSAPCVESKPKDSQTIDPNSIDVKGNVCMAGKFSCDKSGISWYGNTYKCNSIDNPGVCQGDPVISCVRLIHLRPFRTEFAHKGHSV